MAWTPEEEARIQAIEAKLNEIQTALNNVASRAMVKQLVNHRQSEIIKLQEEVESLKTQIATLQAFHQ